jgi:hypothetical protein
MAWRPLTSARRNRRTGPPPPTASTVQRIPAESSTCCTSAKYSCDHSQSGRPNSRVRCSLRRCVNANCTNPSRPFGSAISTEPRACSRSSRRTHAEISPIVDRRRQRRTRHHTLASHAAIPLASTATMISRSTVLYSPQGFARLGIPPARAHSRRTVLPIARQVMRAACFSALPDGLDRWHPSQKKRGWPPAALSSLSRSRLSTPTRASSTGAPCHPPARSLVPFLCSLRSLCVTPICSAVIPCRSARRRPPRRTAGRRG